MLSRHRRFATRALLALMLLACGSLAYADSAWNGTWQLNVAEFESLAAKKVDESTIDATLKRAGKAVATTSRTLSKDKKTMTVTTKGTNRAGQAMNNVLVFDRQ